MMTICPGTLDSEVYRRKYHFNNFNPLSYSPYVIFAFAGDEEAGKHKNINNMTVVIHFNPKYRLCLMLTMFHVLTFYYIL